MGTLTATVTQPINAGSELKIEGTFAFGNSYATGGESIDVTKLGLSSVNRILLAPTEEATLGTVFFEYVNSTSKVKAYAGSGGGGGVTGATSGGTPTGTVAAPVFAGDPMAGHTHDIQREVLASNTKEIRVYLGGITGTPAPGDTMTGGTSTETATVSSYVGDSSYVVITGPSGAFTTGEAMSFAPSGATATNMIGNLVDAWTFNPPLDPSTVIECCGNYTTGAGLLRAPARISAAAPTIALASGSYRFYTTISSLETLTADAITQLQIEHAFSAVSSDSAGTPAGTNSAPAFAGDLLATHTHAIGAGGVVDEVANATNLSTLTAVKFEAYGY